MVFYIPISYFYADVLSKITAEVTPNLHVIGREIKINVPWIYMSK
jgi:hypothetical protein